MRYANQDDLSNALVNIFEELMDFSKEESTPIPDDLIATKNNLETYFFKFDLTKVKEATLFQDHIPKNFSLSGALAI